MVTKLSIIFVVGIVILVSAIALNALAMKLGLSTWYDFVKKPAGTSLPSYIWLFLIYPLALGASAYFALKLSGQLQ